MDPMQNSWCIPQPALSKVSKDISNIPTESSSKGQKLKKSKKYETSLKNKKVVFILQKH